jgi:uncharacterized glyoxalase superfamily protein PhnB
MGTLTPHLVTRDPAVAAAWYGEVLGAIEEGRITLPGGRVLSVDLRFGDSRLAIGDEFPDLGIVSPLTLGGTYGALHLAVADAAAMWQKALEAGAKVFERPSLRIRGRARSATSASPRRIWGFGRFCRARDSPRHSSSCRLTTLAAGIDSMGVRGGVGGKGAGYPIGAG